MRDACALKWKLYNSNLSIQLTQNELIATKEVCIISCPVSVQANTILSPAFVICGKPPERASDVDAICMGLPLLPSLLTRMDFSVASSIQLTRAVLVSSNNTSTLPMVAPVLI